MSFVERSCNVNVVPGTTLPLGSKTVTLIDPWLPACPKAGCTPSPTAARQHASTLRKNRTEKLRDIFPPCSLPELLRDTPHIELEPKPPDNCTRTRAKPLYDMAVPYRVGIHFNFAVAAWIELQTRRNGRAAC